MYIPPLKIIVRKWPIQRGINCLMMEETLKDHWMPSGSSFSMKENSTILWKQNIHQNNKLDSECYTCSCIQTAIPCYEWKLSTHPDTYIYRVLPRQMITSRSTAPFLNTLHVNKSSKGEWSVILSEYYSLQCLHWTTLDMTHDTQEGAIKSYWFIIKHKFVVAVQKWKHVLV